MTKRNSKKYNNKKLSCYSSNKQKQVKHKLKLKLKQVKVKKPSYTCLTKTSSFVPKGTPFGHNMINHSIKTSEEDFAKITVQDIVEFNKSVYEDFKEKTFKEKFPFLRHGFYPLKPKHFVHFSGKSANLTIFNGILTFFTVVTNDKKRIKDLRTSIFHYSKFIRVSLVVVCKPRENTDKFLANDRNLIFLRNFGIKINKEHKLPKNVNLFIVDGHKHGLASSGYSRGCAIQLMNLYYGNRENFVVFISDDRRSLRKFVPRNDDNNTREIYYLDSDDMSKIIDFVTKNKDDYNDTVWSSLNFAQCGRIEKSKFLEHTPSHHYRDLSQIIWYKSSTMKSVLERIGNYPIFPILQDYIFAGLLYETGFKVKIIPPRFGFIKSDCDNSVSLCRPEDSKGRFVTFYDNDPIKWYYSLLAAHTLMPFLKISFTGSSKVYTYTIMFGSCKDSYKIPYLLDGYNWGDVSSNDKPVGGSQTQFLCLSNYLYTRLVFNMDWSKIDSFLAFVDFFNKFCHL